MPIYDSTNYLSVLARELLVKFYFSYSRANRWHDTHQNRINLTESYLLKLFYFVCGTFDKDLYL